MNMRIVCECMVKMTQKGKRKGQKRSKKGQKWPKKGQKWPKMVKTALIPPKRVKNRPKMTPI